MAYLGNQPKDPISVSTTAPSNPKNGAVWFNSALGETFVYYDDGDTAQWVQTNPSGQQGPTGPTGPAGANGEVLRTELDAYLQVANLSNLSTSLIPSANVTYDLGSTTKYWKDLYLSGNTIFLGSAQITLNANGGIDLPAGSRTGGTAIGTGSGGGASVTISDSAPGSPSAGDLWWSANTSELFIYYNDTDTNQWVQATTPGATGPAGASGSSVTSYANTSAFPSSGNSVGDFAFATNTKVVYIWDGLEWDRVAHGNDESPVIITEPPTTTQELNSDGTTSTVTMVAQDPEGFDVTYGIAYKTTGNALPSQLASATTVNANGVYTFTPSANSSHAGSFRARLSASDGARTTTRLVDFSLAFNATITYIMYGGGGGGGGHRGGGGGAGGLIDGTSSSTTLIAGNTYNITVGSGGSGGTASGATGGTKGTNGGDTTFLGQTAIGGGAGAGRSDSTANAAASGGSGGGGASLTSGTTPGSGTAGQGNAGGSGYNASSQSSGGGGGGAGGVGGNGGSNVGGARGAGSSISITGSAVTYCQGGGGGGSSTDGLGGGASSGKTGVLGGGGGGGQLNTAGAAGSGGAVIISSDRAYVSATGSPSLTMNGNLYVYTFTTDGSITF